MKILLITNTESNSLKTVLQQYGKNSVTVVTDNFLVSPTSLEFDIIVCTVITAETSFGARFQSFVNTHKKPVIVGYVNYGGKGIGGNSNNALGALGLASAMVDQPGQLNCKAIGNHSILTKNYLENGTVYPAYESSYYMTTVNTNNLAQGCEILSNLQANEAALTFLSFPKGITTLTGQKLLSDVLFIGFLQPYQKMGQIAINLIHSSLEFLDLKPYQIKGRVVNAQEEPLIRTVMVLDQRTNLVLEVSESDSNGDYTFILKENVPYSVICTPLTSGNNSQIRANILPELRVIEE